MTGKSEYPFKVNKRQAFNNMVTSVLKDCEEHGFTLSDLENLSSIVKEYYCDNAILNKK